MARAGQGGRRARQAVQPERAARPLVGVVTTLDVTLEMSSRVGLLVGVDVTWTPEPHPGAGYATSALLKLSADDAELLAVLLASRAAQLRRSALVEHTDGGVAGP